MTVTFERPRLHEQVLAHMTHLLTDGDWRPGTMLPAEDDLAQTFKVSRTVIRECVRVLASRGILDVRQGRGICVLPHAEWKVAEPLALLVRTDHDSFSSWHEVRTLLEMDCAGLAAQRATAEDCTLLDALVDEQRLCDANPTAYRDLDIRFHLTIAQAAHNPALLRLLEGVIQPLREQLEERNLTPTTRHASTQEHQVIVTHIRDRNVAETRAAMAMHLGRVIDEINHMLRVQGVDQEHQEWAGSYDV